MKTTSITRKAALIAFSFCLLAMAVTSGYSQSMWPYCGKGKASGNRGLEFLLVYMQNDPDETLEAYQDVYIASTGDTATVTISCNQFTNPGDSTIVTLQANQGKSIKLSALHPSRRYMVTSDEVVNKLVVHVFSTSPIICYGMNHRHYTADAFMALPKDVAKLSSRYMIMAFGNSRSPAVLTKKSSEFAVAAFEDNTTVTIKPKATTLGGAIPGTELKYTLNAMECVQIMADPNLEGDLTGSDVTADKPIAVYAGHERADVPHNYVYIDKDGNSHTSRDHLAEAMPPIETWGYQFIAANFKQRTLGDLMRILSKDDGNVITVNGNPWCTLNAGQFADTLIAFDTNPAKNIFAVNATKPSLVGMYCHTTDSSAGIGDPFFAIVPPLNQTSSDYFYFISEDPVYTLNQYLMVITERSGVGAITTTDPSGFQATWPAQSYVNNNTVLNGKQYSVAWLGQNTGGIWRIKSSREEDHGMIILAYGFGVLDSYGYTAGGLFKPLSGLMQIKGDAPMPHPGDPLPPKFKIMNIMGQPVYFDSMVVRYTSNPENIPVYGMGMQPKALGELGAAEVKTIILTPEHPSNEPITGTATIYYRAGGWDDMTPEVLDFRIEAGAMASVASDAFSSEITLSTNPVHNGVTTLNFSLKNSAHVSLKVYDALGRIVSSAFDGRLSDGPQTLAILTRNLSNGSYFFELSVPQLGIAKRGEFIVAQ